MTTTNFSVKKCLQRARELLGVKYTHQGRSETQGFDCSGLIIECLTFGGWKPAKPSVTLTLNYTEEGSWRRISDALKDEGYKIPIECVLPCDLLVLKYGEVPQHFAIVSNVVNGVIYVIHTHQGFGKAVEHQMNGPLMKQVYCAWRFNGRVPNDPLAE